MGGKGGGKRSSGKEDRKARKAESNRAREKQHRKALDRSHLNSFAGMLRESGYLLREVERDGNCFFRSLADQLENQQHAHDKYRQHVVAYMEAHEDDFAPFLTFGEGDEEDDKDFEEYTSRMRRDGEWAGQPELLAASQALGVHIVVHQLDAPGYKISSERPGAPCIHVSYHDGEHYNSVHPLESKRRVRDDEVVELAVKALLAATGSVDAAAAREAISIHGADVDGAIAMIEEHLRSAELGEEEGGQAEGAGDAAAAGRGATAAEGRRRVNGGSNGGKGEAAEGSVAEGEEEGEGEGEGEEAGEGEAKEEARMSRRERKEARARLKEEKRLRAARARAAREVAEREDEEQSQEDSSGGKHRQRAGGAGGGTILEL